MFVVTRIDFDGLENHISSAQTVEYKYFLTRRGASNFVKKASGCRHYRGWDQELYPKFKIEEAALNP
jgi:hypothetical protein